MDPATMAQRGGRRGSSRLRVARALSARELEVLTWVARGKSAGEIGQILNIAERTVNAHTHSAVRKIRAVNRIHAVAIAVRDHLIEF